MNYFTKKKISSQIIAIVDVWSYKIRVWICEFKNKTASLIWYWERRQSEEDIINGEIINIENLSENIKLAIKKAEKDWQIKVDNIIINSLFTNSFFYTTTINYKRKDEKIFINCSNTSSAPPISLIQSQTIAIFLFFIEL